MEHPYPTLTVNAALGQYIRSKLSSGKLIAAGATDINYLGTTAKETFAANEPVSIIPATMPGVRKMVANAAITALAQFEYAAAGKIQPLDAGFARGIVLDAATADGDIVRVLEYPPQNGRGAAVANLDQNISGTYVEAEVEAISDKVDALLASLRAAGLIASA